MILFYPIAINTLRIHFKSNRELGREKGMAYLRAAFGHGLFLAGKAIRCVSLVARVIARPHCFFMVWAMLLVGPNILHSKVSLQFRRKRVPNERTDFLKNILMKILNRLVYTVVSTLILYLYAEQAQAFPPYGAMVQCFAGGWGTVYSSDQGSLAWTECRGSDNDEADVWYCNNVGAGSCSGPILGYVATCPVGYINTGNDCVRDTGSNPGPDGEPDQGIPNGYCPVP